MQSLMELFGQAFQLRLAWTAKDLSLAMVVVGCCGLFSQTVRCAGTAPRVPQP